MCHCYNMTNKCLWFDACATPTVYCHHTRSMKQSWLNREDGAWVGAGMGERRSLRGRWQPSSSVGESMPMVAASSPRYLAGEMP